MDAEIRPEPTEEERQAILAALAQELPAEPDPRGAWWRLGLEESLSREPAEGEHPRLGERPGDRVAPPGS